MSPNSHPDSVRAVLFPGQGSQFIGMAKDLFESEPVARQLFEMANERMGRDLMELCSNGPQEALNATDVCQPAIFVASLAAVKVIENSGGAAHLESRATAGLSLGEYSALVYCGALQFEDALDVVIARGRAMQEACEKTEGTMASILGLDLTTVREAVAEAAEAGIVAVANVNAATQIVISGERAAVELAGEKAKEKGARRVIPLEVAGAYHSPLMASATEKLKPILAGLQISEPQVPFYANVSGGRVSDPEEIRKGLIQQVESSVLWEPILSTILGDGVEEVLEPGPGKVVAGLVRQIDRSIPTRSVLGKESIEELLEGTVS
ncbi:[acyl-carrier-protein] S-malonyltransferase [bacterium TMED181]|nr:[acyl-carrier-protein] S-malonyltransferase [Planctomycetota bacterium]OUW44447.1 MAG: [acyl-carrier-protein] S-malonyltransferase [bacterium TMED181]